MHETGLIRAAVAAVVTAAGGRRVLHVTLALGPGVGPDAAEQAWRQAAAGGPAEGARLAWRRARDGLACLGCGRDYPGDRLTRCPDCGGDGLVVSPAPEVEIVTWTAAPPS
ncbi:hydrogenase maturation nickel metallochaperone HypA [Actinomadura sp. ATCC 31491]|uniref:Hydrogenase maturation nickel metallochaperone HypA n=1 Tax=Actinomadura luzonensis TaxID=2805427 RepID=A0ABT0FX74_9ACTN|nr:hydrogenase/urease maturation nickel metallochaperone HypA [Actinomadura luzonensis]MCK2216950.1 hydrogenase maturation nickel metallochaperone HypA [Actinomadura luzonensis]